MSTQVPTSSEPGVSTLLKGIVGDLGDLIKQEIRFAKTEVKTDLSKIRTPSRSSPSGRGSRSSAGCSSA